MKKQFWLLMLLSSLLVFSTMFVACEEDEDEITGTEPVSELVGTWMLQRMEMNGEYEEAAATLVIDEAGTGVMYTDQEDDHHQESFTWSVTNDSTIILDTAESEENTTIHYVIENDVITMTLTAADQSVEQIFVKVLGEGDTDLLGIWQISTSGGEPVDGFESLEFLVDGIGESVETIERAFAWSVNGDKLLIVKVDGILGKVVDYVINGDNLEITDFLDDGEDEEIVFIPFVERTYLDSDLYGVWILETPHADEELPVTFRFYADGSICMTDHAGPTVGYLWSVSGDTLSSGIRSHYVVSGNTLTLTRADIEPHTYYKLTSDVVSELAETWIKVGMTVNGDIEYADEVTVYINGDGTAEYRSSREYGEVNCEEYYWAAYDDHFVMMSARNYSGMVFSYGFTGGELTLTSNMYRNDVLETAITTFHKFEGENPAEYVGTWYVYLSQIEPDNLAPFETSENYATLMIYDNGKGAYVAQNLTDESSESAIESNFDWVVDGDHIILLDEENVGQILPQSLVGDNLQIIRPWNRESDDQGEDISGTHTQNFIRYTGEYDEALIAVWTLMTLYHNDEGQQVEGGNTLDYFADGTGLLDYPANNRIDFTWSTSNGYVIENSFDPNETDMHEAIFKVRHFAVDDEFVVEVLVVTEYMEGFDGVGPNTVTVVSNYDLASPRP
jgi:Lipocalin-like domain